jgi:hypothetical protein
MQVPYPSAQDFIRTGLLEHFMCSWHRKKAVIFEFFLLISPSHKLRIFSISQQLLFNLPSKIHYAQIMHGLLALCCLKIRAFPSSAILVLPRQHEE